MKYPILPTPAPRMTRADAWKKRDCVLRYRKFRDEVRYAGIEIPEEGADIMFEIPMPASWSITKRNKYEGTPHQQKPDLDNLIKALFDAVFENDCRVFNFSASKYWADEGAIEITEPSKNI